MKKRRPIAWIYFILILLLGNFAFAADKENDPNKNDPGKQLFANNCSVCHDIDKEIIGPALASITKKRTEEWLKNFIKNSQNVITSGDAYAVSLFENYNHTVMPPFTKLSDEEVGKIISYIDKASITGDGGTDDDKYAIENPAALRGHVLFLNLCSECHALDKEIYGPALASVSKRHPVIWLHNFISNSQAVIKSGDPYSSQLYERYDHKRMPPFNHLSKEEIESVLYYIKYASESPVHKEGVNGRHEITAVSDAPGKYFAATGTSPRETEKEVTKEDHSFEGVFFALIAFAAFVFVIILMKLYKTIAS